jgi:hypothetical protein
MTVKKPKSIKVKNNILKKKNRTKKRITKKKTKKKHKMITWLGRWDLPRQVGGFCTNNTKTKEFKELLRQYQEYNEADRDEYERIYKTWMNLTLGEEEYFSDITMPWPKSSDFESPSTTADSVLFEQFAFSFALESFRKDIMVYKKIAYSHFYVVFCETPHETMGDPVQFLKVLKYLNKENTPVPRSLFIRAIHNIDGWRKDIYVKDILRKLYEGLVVTGINNDKYYDVADKMKYYDALTKEKQLTAEEGIFYMGITSDLEILAAQCPNLDS